MMVTKANQKSMSERERARERERESERERERERESETDRERERDRDRERDGERKNMQVWHVSACVLQRKPHPGPTWHKPSQAERTRTRCDSVSG